MSTSTPAPSATVRQPHSRLQRASQRVMGAGPSIAMSMLGAGLLALAAVEAGLLVRPEARAEPRQPRFIDSRSELASAAPAMGTRMASDSYDPSQSAPERGGTVIGITCDSATTGITMYRLWSSGRIEGMMLGESNVWTEWTPVAPGLNGNLPKKKGPGDNS